VCTRYGFEEIHRRVGQVPAGRVHLVYHGLSPAQFEAAAGTEPLILAIGRLQAKKGFATLIDACRRLRERAVEFRCVIAGEGPERRVLEADIARQRLEGVVQLVGERTQEQVAALLGSARVFALPCVITPAGDRDSLPNVILEALAAGVPVVTTPVAGIPEVIVDGRTGLLVSPGDGAALAARIEELLKNGSLCRTIIAFGKAAVAERFEIARNLAPLAALFERMRHVE
jgi:glycosyltransferase involved in cell wall biosynthesis